MLIINDVLRIVKEKTDVCDHSTKRWNFAAGGFSRVDWTILQTVTTTFH